MYLMNRIKLVAFDLDGTIADTLPLCIKAFRMAVQPYISQTLSEDDIIKDVRPERRRNDKKGD